MCGCRLGKGMNDGEGEKVTRQGGYCLLRRQMIEKEGKKEPRIKTGGEGGWTVKLANDRSTCISSSSSWKQGRRKQVVIQLRSWRQRRVRLCCLVGLTGTSRKEEIKQEGEIIDCDCKNSCRNPGGRGGTAVSNGRGSPSGNQSGYKGAHVQGRIGLGVSKEPEILRTWFKTARVQWGLAGPRGLGTGIAGTPHGAGSQEQAAGGTAAFPSQGIGHLPGDGAEAGTGRLPVGGWVAGSDTALWWPGRTMVMCIATDSYQRVKWERQDVLFVVVKILLNTWSQLSVLNIHRFCYAVVYLSMYTAVFRYCLKVVRMCKQLEMWDKNTVVRFVASGAIYWFCSPYLSKAVSYHCIWCIMVQQYRKRK